MNATDIVNCPWCKAKQQVSDCLLGALGTAFHFRCRECGGEFSQTTPTKEPDHELDDQGDRSQAI